MKKVSDDIYHFQNRDVYISFDPTGKWRISKDYSTLSAKSTAPSQVRNNASSFCIVIVFISNRCNLSCEYCKFKSTTDLMQSYAFDLDNIIKSIENVISGKKYTSIMFYGGEPLLEIKRIEKICAYFSSNFKDVSYSVTTNGTIISNSIISIIKKHKISTTVSFDGDRTSQNNNRPFKDNSPSYDVLSNNYKALKENGIECGPLAVINDPKKYKNIFQFFINNFHDKKVYLKPIDGYGDEKSFSDYYSEFFRQQISLLADNMKLFSNTGVRFIESKTKKMINNILLSELPRNKVCDKPNSCGLGDGLVSVRIDGSITPCHDLEKFDHVNNNMICKIKSRNNYCSGCFLVNVCSSFCLSQFDYKYINRFVYNGDKSLVGVICDYNKKFIHHIFSIIIQDKDTLIAYMAD